MPTHSPDPLSAENHTESFRTSASGESSPTSGGSRTAPALLAVAAVLLLSLIGTRVVVGRFNASALPVCALLWTGIVLTGSARWASRRARQQYEKPLHDLGFLLTEIQRSEAPLEELRNLSGTVGSLAAVMTKVFEETRRHSAQVAATEAELEQRLANRTNAMERTIGSLRQQASRDPLTGLYNRRNLDEHLPAVLRKAADEGIGLCLLMIDVDHFKHLNDTLGHPAGDKLLKDIALLLRSSIRECDRAFRCGGDEFVVVLPGTDRPAAEILAARIMSLVDGLGRMLGIDPRPRLSVGLVSRHELLNPTASDMLQRADQLLYEQKGSRRRQGAKRPAAAVQPGSAA